MKLFKKVISCMFVFMLVFGMTITSYASSYSQKRGACTRCGTYNYSYGWNPSTGNRSDGKGPGNRCEYCKIIVPKGEWHYYTTVSDLYYFNCKGSECSHLSFPDRVYVLLYENPPINHSIESVY